MQVAILAENTALNDNFGAEHGLSVWLSSAQGTYLVDTGASSLFACNARKLKLNLNDVETLILTHGHADHTGGVATFLANNSKAKMVFTAKAWTQGHYSLKATGLKDISFNLEEPLLATRCLAFEDEVLVLNPAVTLFKTLSFPFAKPSCNANLYMGPKGLGGNTAVPSLSNSGLMRDDFSHECSVLVRTLDNKVVLCAGCAHNGILNILETAFKILGGKYPDYCIGGMHLSGNSMQNIASSEQIVKLAQGLKVTKTKFYTGHCTGEYAFNILKEQLGAQIEAIKSGLEFEL